MRALSFGILALVVACGSKETTAVSDPSSQESSVGVGSGEDATVNGRSMADFVPVSKHYSPRQMSTLTRCAIYGKVVYNVLLAKGSGATLEQTLAHLRETAPEILDDFVEGLVKDVYLQPKGPVFEVMDAFYGDFCIETSTDIPEGQREIAQRCLRSTYVSLEASAARKAGLTEAQVNQHFASIDYARPLAEPIIARAFAPSPSPSQDRDVLSDEWFRCFKEAE